MINLDTHVLVHAWAGEVTPRERALLMEAPWSISAIVLWELAKLVRIGRLELDLTSTEVGRLLSAVHVWPLDLAVCAASTRLDFRSDPADELIAGTSIVHGLPLLTRDHRILASRQVPLAR